MTDKPMKIPGPDHPISIDANPSRVVVTVAGKVIADTRNALTLREASYPAFSTSPVGRRYGRAHSQRTYDVLPLQGRAFHYSIPGWRGSFAQSVWTYETLLKRWRRSRITSPLPGPGRRDQLADAAAGSVTRVSSAGNAHRQSHQHGECIMTTLLNQTALVTGASRGMGRATALALGRRRRRIVVHYGLNVDEAKAVVD